ncbi:MAG: hypothetical protein K0Q89_45 [Thermomicrobiales bacterium]|nr:hypothetical protein [Thermomicrobiales bacterium]
MRILDVTQPAPKPVVVEAVEFHPWPFAVSSVQLLGTVGYINSLGDLEHLEHDLPGFTLNYADTVLCKLSDGTLAVTSLEGLGAYTNQGRF